MDNSLEGKYYFVVTGTSSISPYTTNYFSYVFSITLEATTFGRLAPSFVESLSDITLNAGDFLFLCTPFN